MKVLVTGVNGQLGYDVVNKLNALNIECVGVDIQDFDITDEKQVFNYFENVKPTAIIHCAAFTAVDRAEDEEQLCFKVNVKGTKNLVAASKKFNCKFMYISTDYVFDGQGTQAFEVDDNKSPINKYGESKYQGELAVQQIEKHFIVRISWVFGENGNNFIKTMLKLGEQRDELSVVCDQIGSPTYTFDLANLLCDMIVTEKYGVYHATNEGYCSWNEFARYIFKCAGKNVKVNEVTSEQYPAKAKRPSNSRLSKKSLDNNGFQRLPKWEDAVDRFVLSYLRGEQNA